MQVYLLVNSTIFANNVANAMYLSSCNVKLSGVILFENNTAENGGAMYLNQGTSVAIYNDAIIQFVGNTAIVNGGAIYVDFYAPYQEIIVVLITHFAFLLTV